MKFVRRVVLQLREGSSEGEMGGKRVSSKALCGRNNGLVRCAIS